MTSTIASNQFTRGYGSFDYEELDYRPGEIVRVDILVNHERVDALAFLSHTEKARPRSLHYCEQLAKTIPRHQFKVPIQGTIGRQTSLPAPPSTRFEKMSPRSAMAATSAVSASC